jgi:hypothetical protein
MFQIAECRRDPSDPGSNIPSKPLPQGVEGAFQAPGTRDHQFAFGYLPQSILQNAHAAEVPGLVAMLGVQNPIEIKKQDGHALAS